MLISVCTLSNKKLRNTNKITSTMKGIPCNVTFILVRSFPFQPDVLMPSKNSGWNFMTSYIKTKDLIISCTLVQDNLVRTVLSCEISLSLFWRKCQIHIKDCTICNSIWRQNAYKTPIKLFIARNSSLHIRTWHNFKIDSAES